MMKDRLDPKFQQIDEMNLNDERQAMPKHSEEKCEEEQLLKTEILDIT